MTQDIKNVFFVFALITAMTFSGIQLYAKEQAFITRGDDQLNEQLVIIDQLLHEIKDERQKIEQLRILSIEQEAELAREEAEAEAILVAKTEGEIMSAQQKSEAEANRLAAIKASQAADAQAQAEKQKAAELQATLVAEQQAKQRAADLAAAQAAAKKSSRNSRAS
jgi:hypothetical protein